MASAILSANAETLLEKRYLQPGESVDQFFDRVSMGNPEYREMLESLDFLPNSPTLFNLGTGNGTLSACFKFDVADEMQNEHDGILDIAAKAAMVQKFGGGVGYYLGNLRPEGAPVASTHGFAMGPVGVMHYYHAGAKMITQGGKREGAQMAILDDNHQDIYKFIESKNKEPQALSTFNISVALHGKYADASPDQLELLHRMAEFAWETGDPGCYFYTNANKRNPTPWLGDLSATNPCGEVPLLPNEACTLGSLNLARFVTFNGEIDLARLKQRVRLAIRYLDDIVDRNQFSHPDITDAVLLTRKVGLGVCGFADLLALHRIRYDSEDAVNFASALAQFISSAALEASCELAEEKGHAPAYDAPGYQSTAIFVEDELPRNTTRTCIAPTGSIAILMGASSGIEPHFALENTRTMGDGTKLQERMSILDDPRVGDFVPPTAHEISWQWHVRHQAAWQEHIDLAVSKTINMPNNATVDDVEEAYRLAWEMGCTGVTVYRDGCRDEQVLQIAAPEDTPAWVQPVARELPDVISAKQRRVRIQGLDGAVKFFMAVGEHPDGHPAQVFIDIARRGTEVDGLYAVIGILTSKAMQYGVPVEELCSAIIGVRFEPAGLTSDPEIPTAASIPDYIFRRILMDFGSASEAVHAVLSGMTCPDCNTRVVSEEGCLKCTSCGWARC